MKWLTGEWLIDKTTAKHRRILGYWLTIISTVMIPVSYITGLAYNISFVTLISLIALQLCGISIYAAETPVETEDLTDTPEV